MVDCKVEEPAAGFARVNSEWSDDEQFLDLIEKAKRLNLQSLIKHDSADSDL